MDRKHILSSFVMAAAFSVHVFSAQAQTTWLWPIKGQETGQGVICAPQQYVGEEFNFGNLIVAAPEGTDVLCPADGVVLNFGVGYEKSLHESVSFHAGSDNFDSILGKLEEVGELKDLPVPTKYVGGDIFIRLEDGRPHIKLSVTGSTGRPDDYARIMLPNSKIMVQIPVIKCVLSKALSLIARQSSRTGN